MEHKLDATRPYDIVAVKNARIAQQDSVAVEEPLEVWIKLFHSGQQAHVQHLMTTMRTPGHDLELVRGWLHAINLIDGEQIHSIRFSGVDTLKGQTSNKVVVTLLPGINLDLSKLQRSQYASSSCGVCGQQSIEWMLDDLPTVQSNQRIHLGLDTVSCLSLKLSKHQPGFTATGGMHGVALIDQSANIVSVFEDVGRHNAMDKLVGANLAILPGKYAVLLSGRVSFEMVQKAARAGISMIIAIGAPTSLAVDLCKAIDIALIGFLKHNQLNIYHGDAQFV